jgi:hypothetical protein
MAKPRVGPYARNIEGRLFWKCVGKGFTGYGRCRRTAHDCWAGQIARARELAKAA